MVFIVCRSRQDTPPHSTLSPASHLTKSPTPKIPLATYPLLLYCQQIQFDKHYSTFNCHCGKREITRISNKIPHDRCPRFRSWLQLQGQPGVCGSINNLKIIPASRVEGKSRLRSFADPFLRAIHLLKSLFLSGSNGQSDRPTSRWVTDLMLLLKCAGTARMARESVLKTCPHVQDAQSTFVGSLDSKMFC